MTSARGGHMLYMKKRVRFHGLDRAGRVLCDSVTGAHRSHILPICLGEQLTSGGPFSNTWSTSVSQSVMGQQHLQPLMQQQPVTDISACGKDQPP